MQSSILDVWVVYQDAANFTPVHTHTQKKKKQPELLTYIVGKGIGIKPEI